MYKRQLTGKGVHIVTVNDYLAKRDSEWMGKVYRFLGLSVGLIIHDLLPEQRRAAYAADVTYGTNNELGFDYLRDNMAIYKQEMVQREHNFVIVDEVDSILIDEARTPLIISGKGEESSKLYEMADYFVSRLKKQVFASTDDKELQDQYAVSYTHLLRLAAEDVRPQRLCRRQTRQLAVVAGVDAVHLTVLRGLEHRQNVRYEIELLLAGLAARHVQLERLRLEIVKMRCDGGLFGGKLRLCPDVYKRQG